MAYIRTTSETMTDNLLVEIDVNSYNEIEVDIKRSGLCVLDESVTANGSKEGCTINAGNNKGFRSVVKRSLTLEKEVSRLKWREEYLTICEDGSIHNSQGPRTESTSIMKNEAGCKYCLSDIKNKPKYRSEKFGRPQKSKEYKGMYLFEKSNISYAQKTQTAAVYMETQRYNDANNGVKVSEENDSFPDELYKGKTDASFAFPSHLEDMNEATLRKHKKKGPKDSDHMHPVSYPRNEADMQNTLNDAVAKSVIIEETGKKLIQFLCSAIGQKLMMEYSNGKQKSNNPFSGKLLDSTLSLDMERIKMIVDTICNALQMKSPVIADEDSSKLQQNLQERITTNKFCSKDCFHTEKSQQSTNNIEEKYIRNKHSGSGLVMSKSEQKLHNLNLKQSNRLQRNKYSTKNCKEKYNTDESKKKGISANSREARNEFNNADPSAKMDNGKKSIFSTIKEIFNAFLKNKLFENCTEKLVSSTQHKAEHQPVTVEGRSRTLGTPQRGEYSLTGTKRMIGLTSIDRGSPLCTRNLRKISKQTVTATHSKTLQNSEYGISNQKKKSQLPYSVASSKSDKSTKWRKDGFQKLLFELLETLCSKIKKKDLKRLSVLLDILLKLQDQNLPSSEHTGNCSETVACYNIKQHTKEYTREFNMNHLCTVSSNKPNLPDASTENERYKLCKTYFTAKNLHSAAKYKNCIQTNLANNSEILTAKNPIKKLEHAQFVANTKETRAVQTNIHPKGDAVLKSNMMLNNLNPQEHLDWPLNHITNKRNKDSKYCVQCSENYGRETVIGGKNNRKLLSCRVRHQRQYAPENHNLTTKEEKSTNNFLSLARPSDAYQCYNHLNPSIKSWQATDGKIKCPVYSRENVYEYSHESAANLDKINQFVTIMGLSEAYELYSNVTSSALCLQRTNSKSKNPETQICTHIHKTADVSSSLYKHAAFQQDSSTISVNKINGVGVKINVPFSNEIIFPNTTKYYKNNLKSQKTLKFYLPVRIQSKNYTKLTAMESENKEARHIFENEEDKSVTDDGEEINLIKEECISERKCSLNPYIVASDECFTLQNALLHNFMLKHPQSNEELVTVCQSVDDKHSTCNEVKTDGMLHETSTIFMIDSTVGKQATHTNNCYQYMHKPLSPWKLEEHVGSFMFGTYCKGKFPVQSGLCVEDDLNSLGDHISSLPKTNFVSPCDGKTFGINIIRETADHHKEVTNSRIPMTKQLPTYFVFSAHDMKSNKEKMDSHITRKTKKRKRISHDPQTHRSNDPQIEDNYSYYHQRPSICLEPTICIHDSASQLAMEHLGNGTYINSDVSPQTHIKNNNIQNKKAKRNKILHHHDFHTSNTPPHQEESKPTLQLKDYMNMDVSSIEPNSVTLSQHPIKNLDKDNPTNLNVCPSSTDLNSSYFPFKINQRNLCSSSMESSNDASKHKTPNEPISNMTIQHSMENLDNDSHMKLNASSSDSTETTSDEHEEIKKRESDYLPVKKSLTKHSIFSPVSEQHDKEIESDNIDDKLVLLQKNGYSGEKSSDKRNIISLERIRMLSLIDANDVAEPENIAGYKDFRSTSVNQEESEVPKDSSRDCKDQNSLSNTDDLYSRQCKTHGKVSKIIQKIFTQKNNDESKEILSPLGDNQDFQSLSSYQFANAELQEKNIKQVNFPNVRRSAYDEETTPRSTGAEYDKWRLSQTRKLLKTHHALIKEAHDLHQSASETGDSDGSNDEDEPQEIKIGQSTWNSCTPADFLLYFRRGFRDDQMTLNNKVCFVERMDLLTSDQDPEENMIDLMITFHPLDFLVKLGYSAEEAAVISQDEEIKCRLYAAIREARIWANAITKPQAALLYLLAHKAKPKIMRYYLCVVESIINRRIVNAVKLNELIDFLECLEDGEIALKDIFEEMAESEAIEEKKKSEDLYTVFHHMAEEEAMNCGKYPLSAKQIFLLQTLVSKYHLALQDHLALLTRYIGRGLIKNTVQLEAALVYLPHVGRHSVNIQEFEMYCGIKSKRN